MGEASREAEDARCSSCAVLRQLISQSEGGQIRTGGLDRFTEHFGDMIQENLIFDI